MVEIDEEERHLAHGKRNQRFPENLWLRLPWERFFACWEVTKDFSKILNYEGDPWNESALVGLKRQQPLGRK